LVGGIQSSSRPGHHQTSARHHMKQTLEKYVFTPVTDLVAERLWTVKRYGQTRIVYQPIISSYDDFVYDDKVTGRAMAADSNSDLIKKSKDPLW